MRASAEASDASSASVADYARLARSFARDGYVVVPDALSPKQLDVVREEASMTHADAREGAARESGHPGEARVRRV